MSTHQPISHDTTVVTARNLRQVYTISNGFMRKPGALQAVSGVSFSIAAGKTLGYRGRIWLWQIHAGAHGVFDRIPHQR